MRKQPSVPHVDQVSLTYPQFLRQFLLGRVVVCLHCVACELHWQGVYIMTVTELARREGVTRQTIYARIRRGKVQRTGKLTKNRRGKASPDYEAPPAELSFNTPRWKVFEIRCRRERISPFTVLEVLVSRCRKDPDLLAMGILLTLYSPRLFLKHLKQEISGTVNSSNATLEAEFATLIGRPPRMEYRRSKPVLPREATFMEMWNEAKHYIYRCLWKGGWRYKVSPMIQNFSGDRYRLIMRPDWQLSLSKNSRHDLEDLNLAHSTQTGEYFPRHFGSVRRRKWEPAELRPEFEKFLSKLFLLDGCKRSRLERVLSRFASLPTTLSYGRTRVEFTNADEKAISWLGGQTGGDYANARRLAGALARRNLGMLSNGQFWRLTNRIFNIRGNPKGV